MIKLPCQDYVHVAEYMLKDLFLLDPDIIFLNHGSFGACPKCVFDKYQDWQRKLELEPVQFLGVELDNYLYHSREEIADYLNCPVSDLVYIQNATHGVNIITHSMQLGPGDEILTTDHEYGACYFAWDFICKKTGATLKRQAIPMPITYEEEIIDQLWKGVSERTKIIFFSHITSPTALIFPVVQICQRARKEGILTLVDGAHAPGQVPVDLSEIQADFYVGNCHKWMLSPKGAGFLYARPEVQHLIEPLIVSWGFQARYTPPHETTFIDFLQWTGTKDPAAGLTVPEAIKFMKENDWEHIRVSCHALLKEAIERINELTGLLLLYPTDSTLYQQMGTISIPHQDNLNELKTRLFKDYKIEIPVIEWNNQHFIRLSVQGYNTADDIEQLVKALTLLLPQLKS